MAGRQWALLRYESRGVRLRVSTGQKLHLCERPTRRSRQPHSCDLQLMAAAGSPIPHVVRLASCPFGCFCRF